MSFFQKLWAKKVKCHYCPQARIVIHEGGNWGTCRACRTNYMFAWKQARRWPYKWKAGDGAVADVDRVERIVISFNCSELPNCFIILNLVENTTSVYTFTSPTDQYHLVFSVPHLMKITPFNAEEKIKKLVVFS